MTISSLNIGQTLSGDVQLANGRRLFSSGHIITEQTLRVLKIWGVRDVPLCDSSNEELKGQRDNEFANIHIDSCTSAMQILFRDADTTLFPISCLLKECIILANRDKHQCDGFFPYLRSSFTANLQSSSSDDYISHVCIDSIFAEYDSIPEDFFVFTKMLNDVYLTSEAVVSAIDKNKRIKNKILKICDSLIHVQGCDVASVYGCTSFLGNRTVLYLALVLVYIHHVKEYYNSDVLMHHGRCAITTGIAARCIAAAVGVYGRECFFSNGILRDIGYMFYSRHFASAYEKVRQKVLCSDADICAVEEQHMGMNHAEVGGRILKKLGFPASIEKSVQQHHTPFNEINTKEYAVMHVAEIVARALTFDPAYDVPHSAVDCNAFKMLNITEVTLSELVKNIYLKSKEIVRLAYEE
ncbi:HDOD domain-containing protein [Halodesulfovibrio aestuarii]|uniref:HDOD domain-containing protein n=1 Tax=Halodesulfovibrio aestuarii TaxID=126333 RepID=A0ABV4JUK9_9BACT